MTKWLKNIAEWTEGKNAYLSIPFTWNLPKAYSKAIYYRQLGYTVHAGGPAVSLMPNYLKDVAVTGGSIDALPHHNPDATFTSRGCIRSCEFCAVPKIEGDLVELDNWEPRPIVCDNNLLACSKAHFDRVIDRLKPLKGIDFNQGLDARLLNLHHIERLQELDLERIRFSWDFTPSEPQIMDAISRLKRFGFPKRKIQVYVLIGHLDIPEDALYRLQTLKNMGIRANPMRFQPLFELKKDSYVAYSWSQKQLRDYMRYWSRQKWFSQIPFKEYCHA